MFLLYIVLISLKQRVAILEMGNIAQQVGRIIHINKNA